MPDDNQHINVPKGDTLRVVVSITDTSGPNADGPTTLHGKTVRWELKTHSWADEAVIEYTDADPKLTIQDADGGVVSLSLDSTETSGEYDNYHHSFIVGEGEDQWTTTRGLLKIE